MPEKVHVKWVLNVDETAFDIGEIMYSLGATDISYHKDKIVSTKDGQPIHDVIILEFDIVKVRWYSIAYLLNLKEVQGCWV